MNKTVAILVFTLIIHIKLNAHPGVGIVMDSMGNIYYTDLEHVWKIDVTKKRTIAVRNVHTHELYIDKEDNLFGEHTWCEGEATNVWGHYVWKLSRLGKLEKVKPPAKGFLTSYSFVRDDHGHMFWTDRTGNCQHVVRSNYSKAPMTFDACFQNVRWMTSTKDGKVFLIDDGALKKIDLGGKTTTIVDDLRKQNLSKFIVGAQHLVMGLWTDPDENVYVAIYGAGHVKKITPEKKVSVVVETSDSWSPTGGMVAPNGDYWLLECSPTNKVRVEQVTKKGERIIYGE